MSQLSPAIDALRGMDEAERAELFNDLGDQGCAELMRDWEFWARPDQLWRPGEERVTVYSCGRGWGKTRTGASAVHYVAQHPHLCGQTPWQRGRISIVGRTAADVRDTMINGESGLLNTAPLGFTPIHYPSLCKVVYPNGIEAHTYSADEPRQLKGPNAGFAWCDELPHWQRAEYAWSQVRMTLRHGDETRAIVTTTPLPTKTFKAIVKHPRTKTIYGSTADNLTNLALDFIEDVYGEYDGTVAGDQELHGQIRADVEGALWQHEWFERCTPEQVPELVRTVVAVDPAGGAGPKNDEAGIVVVALGANERIYVLADLSGKHTYGRWGFLACSAYLRFDCEAVVAETNHGGDMVESNVMSSWAKMFKDAPAPRRMNYQPLLATHSKKERADDVARIWDRREAFHVGPEQDFRKLEIQCCDFDPNLPKTLQDSPDRMDALVWGVRALLSGGSDRRKLRALGQKSGWAEIAKRLQAAPPWESSRFCSAGTQHHPRSAWTRTRSRRAGPFTTVNTKIRAVGPTSRRA